VAGAAGSGSAQVSKAIGQTATLTWNAPTTYVGGASIPSGTTITYNVMSGAGTCTNATMSTTAASNLTATSWVTPPYTATGATCYDVTATVNGETSGPSNSVEVDVSAIPNAPGNLTAQ